MGPGPGPGAARIWLIFRIFCGFFVGFHDTLPTQNVVEIKCKYENVREIKCKQKIAAVRGEMCVLTPFSVSTILCRPKTLWKSNANMKTFGKSNANRKLRLCAAKCAFSRLLVCQRYFADPKRCGNQMQI